MSFVVTSPRRTTFTIAARPGLGEMTKVKLLPYIAAKAGKITGISFGRNRTPSPFGNKMGDHTGSWTSVFDSVHARLYGKDLEERGAGHHWRPRPLRTRRPPARQ